MKYLILIVLLFGQITLADGVAQVQPPPRKATISNGLISPMAKAVAAKKECEAKLAALPPAPAPEQGFFDMWYGKALIGVVGVGAGLAIQNNVGH